MTHTISEDRKTLTIRADEVERQELRDIQQCGGDCQCDVSMHDFLSSSGVCEDLEWIFPEETGDLTDAPMLGFIQAAEDGRTRKVLERWAFTDYAVRSVLEDLRDKGEAKFTA